MPFISPTHLSALWNIVAAEPDTTAARNPQSWVVRFAACSSDIFMLTA
jgi:hypothetical protein